ncbi:hypothetical protein RERY_07080 [Rhodococcus erythropolis]|nr:hypothetical protein RERY_07080 [Rhodococcus erythropolis]
MHEAQSPATGLVPPAITCATHSTSRSGADNATTSRSPAQNRRRPATSSASHHDSTRHATLTLDPETGLLTRWITYRDNNPIAEYELTTIIRPRHRPTSKHDGTITAISFDDKTIEA